VSHPGTDPFLEEERVASAQRLVTSTTNPALDRLADLAARLLGAPAAQVSLLSTVQTISAGVGLDEATRQAVTSLADSLCTVTATSGQALIVVDAAVDDRVNTLPPVTSGQVGAYLGVPMRGQDGNVVGALCVFGPAARSWAQADVALLSDLAAAAVAELELTALAVDFEAARVRHRLAVSAGGVGTFDWDLLTGTLAWDERLLEMFGYSADDFGASIEAFNARLHPDDLPRVSQALSTCIAECGQFAAEYRVVRPDGSTRWVRARGQALADENGVAVRVLGAAYDTTADRDEDARVARVLESMTSAFYSLDRRWRFTYVNAQAERLLGRPRGELIGGTVWDLFPGTVGSAFEKNYRTVATSGAPVTFEAFYPAPLNGWFEVRAWPNPDGVSVYFVDITERRRTQDELLAAREEAEFARAQAEAALDRAEVAVAQASLAVERLRLIARVSQDLTATFDLSDAVDRLTHHLVPTLADWCLLTLVDDHGVLRDVGAHHVDPARRDVVLRYREERLHALTGDSYLHRVWRTSQPVGVVENATQTITTMLNPASPAHDHLRLLAPEAFECLPMRARGRTIGLITLFHDSAASALSAEDLLLAGEIADRAGLALDNARLYSDQHQMAEGLQRSLLTAPVEPDHLHVTVRYRPAAQAARVGGDWYDAFLTPDGATVLVIGDVMGHDIEAAAGMSQVRSLLRGIAYSTGAGPAQVLSGLDAAMQGLAVDTTATAIVARIEQDDDHQGRATTRLRWANAGHLNPVLIAPDGSVTALATVSPQLLLGVDPSTTRSDALITVERGSTLIMFTDGLVERRDQPLEQGLLDLQAVLTDLAGEPLDDLVDGLLARLLSQDQDDDVAVVAVRLHPEDRPRPAEAGPVRLPDAVPAVDSDPTDQQS